MVANFIYPFNFKDLNFKKEYRFGLDRNKLLNSNRVSLIYRYYCYIIIWLIIIFLILVVVWICSNGSGSKIYLRYMAISV